MIEASRVDGLNYCEMKLNPDGNAWAWFYDAYRIICAKSGEDYGYGYVDDLLDTDRPTLSARILAVRDAYYHCIRCGGNGNDPEHEGACGLCEGKGSLP